jgi:hypothetical protein
MDVVQQCEKIELAVKVVENNSSAVGFRKSKMKGGSYFKLTVTE